MSNSDSMLRGLRLQWVVATSLYTLGLVVVYLALSAWWGPAQALRWLSLSVAAAMLILVDLLRGLGLNHRCDETELLPGLGAATALTLTRGLLLAVLAGFLLLPVPPGTLIWAPSLCYLAAALLDYADGGVARATHHSTLLGEKLDTDLDALGIAVAPLLAVLYGKIPVIYLIVSLCRYLFAGGIWLLKRQGRPVYNLTESERRRNLAGYQMGLNVAVLFPFLVPPVTALAASLFMAPFLVGFVRDWLVVSGAVDPQSEHYRALALWAERVFYGWLPTLYRAGVGGLFVSFVLTEASASSEHRVVLILMVVQAVLAVMILAGIFGRLSALGLVAATGLAYSGARLDLPAIALAACLILVMLFGAGCFALSQAEDRFLRFHAGAKS